MFASIFNIQLQTTSENLQYSINNLLQYRYDFVKQPSVAELSLEYNGILCPLSSHKGRNRKEQEILPKRNLNSLGVAIK